MDESRADRGDPSGAAGRKRRPVRRRPADKAADEDAIEQLEEAIPGSPSELGRQVSKDLLVYTVGSVVANAILYLAVPIYTRVFEPAEYSKFAFVTTVSGMLAGVLVLGGDTALTRFWFQDRRVEAWRRLCTTWIGFLTVWAVGLCLVLAPLAPALATWALDDRSSSSLFLLMLAALPVMQTSRLLAQVMRNEFRAGSFVMTGVLLGATSLGLGLLFAIVLDLGVAGIFVGILLAESLTLLVRGWLTRRQLLGTFDRSLLNRLLRFGVPLVPVTVSFWVFTAADRLVVAKVAGLTELGYYSVAVTFTMVFVVLSTAVTQAWLPRATHLFEVDAPRAARAIGTSLTYYLFGLGVLATTIASLAPELIRVLSGPTYAPAASAVPLLCMGSVAYGTLSITSIGMTLSHRTGRLALLSVCAAGVNVAAALLLVPRFGIAGAAGASLVGYSLLTTGYLWLSQRLWPVRLETRRLIVVVVCLGVVGILSTVRAEDPLIVRLLLAPGFVVGCLIFAGIRPEERQALSVATRTLRRRGPVLCRRFLDMLRGARSRDRHISGDDRRRTVVTRRSPLRRRRHRK